MKTWTADAEFFDIKQTLECGQVFRFKKTDDGGYVIHSLDKRCFLRREGDKIILSSDDEAYFRNYFDLDTDYGAITSRLSAFPELTAAVSFGKGIRILRQDFYEAVFSFIVSANNNIGRIKGIIERLCDAYGTDCGDYHAFPNPEQLSLATVEQLKKLGLGYRAQYIYDSVRAFSAVSREIDLSDAEKTHKKLLTLKGVGPKVADCIVLFGLHITRSYPVDTWIFKANATDALNTPQKVRDYFLSRYGEDAGFAQQYVFYYARENRITSNNDIKAV